MGRRNLTYARYGMAILALAALPLAGCSSLNFAGNSTFGSGPRQIANISGIDKYTANQALSEARSHFANNDFGYSAALYKRVVELAPSDPEGYVGLSASYDRLGRFDLSDRVYASLYKLSGGTAQYYNNLGYSYMLRGKLTLALTTFRKAAAIDPNNVVVANNLRMLANAATSARA